MPAPDPRAPQGADRAVEGEVPVFGTWARIHAAVVLSALAVMGLLALFSRWPF
jgi:hypothetical protein